MVFSQPSPVTNTIVKWFPAQLLLSAALALPLGAADTNTAPVQPVPVGPVEIARFAGNRVAAVSYTFDDGTLGHYQVAAPTLERFGFRGTFGVVAGHVADTPETAELLAHKLFKGTNVVRRATWPEWRELTARGHEIANHSLMHRGLPSLSDDQLEREVEEARRIITVLNL